MKNLFCLKITKIDQKKRFSCTLFDYRCRASIFRYNQKHSQNKYHLEQIAQFLFLNHQTSRSR